MITWKKESSTTAYAKHVVDLVGFLTILQEETLMILAGHQNSVVNFVEKIKKNN